MPRVFGISLAVGALLAIPLVAVLNALEPSRPIVFASVFIYIALGTLLGIYLEDRRRFPRDGVR